MESRAEKEGIWNGDLKAKNVWLYGPAGTGKSRWARSHTEIRNIFSKQRNKWWDGYREQKIVLIDDWDKEVLGLTKMMCNWADRYPFTGETKGSAKTIAPGTFFFIVTSNYSIDESFADVDRGPMKRRFTEIQLFEQFGAETIDFTLDFNILGEQ
jgi:hypothetical protein